MTLRQVMLVRPSETGEYRDVAWIDNRLARVGKRVATEDGVVWTVRALYNAKERDDVLVIADTARRYAEVVDD